MRLTVVTNLYRSEKVSGRFEARCKYLARQSTLAEVWQKRIGVASTAGPAINVDLGGTEMLMEFGYETDENWWRNA
jgi:hypothetical protein